MHIVQKPKGPGFLPSDVRYCKALPYGARLLYCELTALCHLEGFCWASNAYFAGLYEVDDRTIQRWIKSIHEEGFIHISMQKNEKGTERRISINQKSFMGRQKCHPLPDEKSTGENESTDTFPRGDKNVVGGETKMSPNIYKLNNTRETTTSTVPSVHKILDPLELTSDQKIRLTLSFPNPEDLAHAIAYVQNPQTKVKTSLMQAIWWAAKNKPEIPKEPKKVVEENKTYAMSLLRTVKFPKNINFDILSKCVEIVYTGSQKQPDIFDYKDLKFKENIGNTLKTMKLA